MRKTIILAIATTFLADFSVVTRLARTSIAQSAMSFLRDRWFIPLPPAA